MPTRKRPPNGSANDANDAARESAVLLSIAHHHGADDDMISEALRQVRQGGQWRVDVEMVREALCRVEALCRRQGRASVDPDMIREELCQVRFRQGRSNEIEPPVPAAS